MNASIDEKRKLIEELLYKLLYNDENLSEDDEDRIVEKIEILSPDPAIVSYIFGKEYEHLTIDEIIEKAFSYKPICLGDQSQQEPE